MKETPDTREYADQLRDKGLKATKQRMAALDLVSRLDGHRGVEQLYNLMRNNGQPRVSMATVYRVLEELADRGLIGYLRLGADKTYYESRTDAHLHAICRRCGTIQDIEPVRQCIESCAPYQSASGFRYDASEVIFVGLCRECQSKEPGSGSKETLTAG